MSRYYPHPMDKTERTELLRVGVISRTLRMLSFPAVAAMLVNAIYNVVDTAFIGLLNDTAAIGAAAVLFPVFMFIGAIGLTFGIGAASVISRKLGEQKAGDARKTASTAFYSALIIGIAFSVVGNIFIEPILILFGATETILSKAVIYGRIIIGGSFFQVINMCMNNILRSEGASGYSGRALAAGAVINIILDPVFMFVFDMGLAGAAAATITAQMLSSLYLLRFFIMKKGILRIKLSDFSPSPAVYRALMVIGFPTFARQLFVSVSMGMLNNAAGVYGDPAVAAIGISFRVVSLVMMVLFGLGQGLQPLAGYNFGAQQFDRVIQSVRTALIWSTVFAGFMSLVFWFAAVPVVRIFSGDADVVRIGSLALRSVCISFVLVGIQTAFASLFQALGRGAEAAVIAVARQGIFFIPAVLVLPGILGLHGVVFAQPAADILSFAVAVPLGLMEMRKLKKQSMIQGEKNG